MYRLVASIGIDVFLNLGIITVLSISNYYINKLYKFQRETQTLGGPGTGLRHPGKIFLKGPRYILSVSIWSDAYFYVSNFEPILVDLFGMFSQF